MRARAVSLAITAVVVLAHRVVVADAPKGFISLFNGKDLAGWHGMPHFDPYKLEVMTPEDRAAQVAIWTADARKHWKVENGELINDGQGAYLTTDKEFGDIELMLEYRTVPKADSGIYLRGTPQIQIWDFTKEGGKWELGADKGSGGLWNNSPGAAGKDPLVLADRPLGEWNQFRILQVGERTTVWLNDKLVVDHARMENYWNRSLPLRSRGPIQLQTHGGEIRWRRIFVREIPPAEANDILRRHGAAGFRSVFNGKDFDGWEGATGNYEIKDDAIICKSGKGGNIFTKEEYGDFVARLEYRLPPGGNNGLAIRYPGQGNAAYGAMCEIQILDDDAPQYAKLDRRQYNGSAYGMAAAHRGHLRALGEWNFMEVAVRGSVIQIELNGTRILDGDLNQVTEYMNDKPHPGKDRKAGHFGFCGHHDPVAFRHILIRELP
jgi:hypothetical protein